MTQSEIDHEVARATGESVACVRRLGFSILLPAKSQPLTVDWDARDEERLGLFPASRKGPHTASRRRNCR